MSGISPAGAVRKTHDDGAQVPFRSRIMKRLSVGNKHRETHVTPSAIRLLEKGIPVEQRICEQLILGRARQLDSVANVGFMLIIQERSCTNTITVSQQPSIQDTPTNKAFDLALTNIISQLPPGVRKEFERHNLPELLVEQALKADAAHSARSHTRGFLGRIQNILAVVDQFLDSVVIAAQCDPGVSSLVLGGVRLALSVGLRFNAYFEAISTTLETITDHLSFLNRYAVQLFPSSNEVQRILTITYQDLIGICYEIWSIFYDHYARSVPASFKVVSRIFWKPVDTRLNRLKARFEYHTKLVVYEAQATMFGMDLEELKAAQRERDQAQHKRDHDSEARQIEKRREVLLFISNKDDSSAYEEIIRDRFETSGLWILAREEFQNWLHSGQSSLLWCHGNPGTGKTVLASIVQDHLVEIYGSDPDVGLGCVFCSYRDLQKPEMFFRSYLRQLLSQCQGLPEWVEDFYDELYRDGKSLRLRHVDLPQSDGEGTNNTTLSTYLIKRFRKVVLVFDALDECEDRESWLLPLFGRLIKQYTGNSGPILKIFVTSRVQSDIERAFRDVPKILVQASSTASDIKAYIHHEIARRIQSDALQIQDPELADEIANVLVGKADGMFLWVKYQLDHLCEQMSDIQIRKALQGLPETLYSHYDRVLALINKQSKTSRDIARSTIRWLACAARRLHQTELVEALAITQTTKSWHDLDIITNPERIVHACHNLVSRSTDGMISFVHYSVQEYFVTDHLRTIETSDLRSFYVDLELTHQSLAIACLVYLSFHDILLLKRQPAGIDFGSHVEASDVLDTWEDHHSSPVIHYVETFPAVHTSLNSHEKASDIPPLSPLARSSSSTTHSVGAFSHYAGSCWHRHWHETAHRNVHIQELFSKVFSQSSSLNYVQGFREASTIWTEPSRHACPRSPVELAAVYGWAGLLRALLEGNDFVSQAFKDRAIILASRYGHGDVINILVEHGVHLGMTSPSLGNCRG